MLSSAVVNPVVLPNESKREALASLRLPSPLPDVRSDAKAWQAIQDLFTPSVTEMEIDKDLLCPITHCLMRDPVTTADGQVYEREAIMSWLKSRDTSPATGARLKTKELIEAPFVRKTIDKLLTQHPELKESEAWYLPAIWQQALRQACESGDSKAAHDLIQKDRRLLVYPIKEGAGAGQYLLHAAVSHEATLEALVKALEQRQPGLGLASLRQADANGQWPLERALRGGRPASTILKLMAWMGESVSDFKLTAPLPAAAQGPLQAALRTCLAQNERRYIPFLLAWGAQDREALNDALQRSIEQADRTYLQQLLSWGAQATAVTRNGEPLLGVALRGGNDAIVTALLEAGASLEVPHPPQGEAALQKAVRLGKPDLVRLLCARGALLGATRTDGQTAVHAAARQEDVTLIQLLCEQKEAKAHLNTRDSQGRTPLQEAVASDQVTVVSYLINQGADLNGADAKGETPLHTAARRGVSAILESLLTAGANREAENQAEQTAREVARETGSDALRTYDAVCATLREREAHLLNEQGALLALLLRQQTQLADRAEQLRALQKAFKRESKVQAEAIATLQQEKAQLETELTKLKEQVRPLDEERRQRENEERERKRQEAEHKQQEEAKRQEEGSRALWRSKLLVLPPWLSSPMHAGVSGASGASQRWLPPSELKTDAKEVGQFLQHVANAEYDAVETWLAKKPEFLLCKGSVTDLSKRTFPAITAFQYALWALDWHMWAILLKYLTPAEAALQWQELETKGTSHGKEVSWQGLIDAYGVYAKASSDWSNIWCKQVGGAQLLVPAHVANEYLHPTRPMYPVPDYTTSARGAGANEFYVDGLGDSFACARAAWPTAAYIMHSFPLMLLVDEADAAAISALYATRRQQKAELVKTLSAALDLLHNPVRC